MQTQFSIEYFIFGTTRNAETTTCAYRYFKPDALNREMNSHKFLIVTFSTRLLKINQSWLKSGQNKSKSSSFCVFTGQRYCSGKVLYKTLLLWPLLTPESHFFFPSDWCFLRMLKLAVTYLAYLDFIEFYDTLSSRSPFY